MDKDMFSRLGSELESANSSVGAHALLAPRVERGSVVRAEIKNEITYQVRLAKRKREMPANIWQALERKTKK